MLYRSRDFAFDFELASRKELGRQKIGGNVSSIAVGTLQIEVSVEEKALLYVWGYHPRKMWCSGSFAPLPYRPGCVRLASELEIRKGISIKLAEVGDWPTVYSPDSGWICVGCAEVPLTSDRVEFATNTVAVVEKGRLLSLWLHPEMA